MKIGIVIYSNDSEAISNALDLANYAQQQGDKVNVFLIGKGVEAPTLSKTEGYARQPFKITEHIKKLIDNGGQIFASGKCLEFRDLGLPDLCVISSMQNLYAMIKESDKVITF